VQQVTIPLVPSHDLLIWKHTDSGELSFADAYNFISPQFQDLDWSKVLWNVDIPPSKSLVAWRLMHNKMPTDENLKLRGCCLPSMCSLSCKHAESSFHIFFECEFAVYLWSWLANCLDMVLQFYTMDDMWKICDLNWAPQSKVVISSALINLLNGIWFARNQCRFNNTFINRQSIISMIKANVSLSGNNTRKVSSSSIRDFILLKNFNVCIHAPAAPILKEVLWLPPLNHWFKCNVDGAAKGNPGLACCGGVFRDHRAEFVYVFAERLGISSSIQAELFAVIFAIDVAFRRQWINLWIETDSAFVVSAFHNSSIVVTRNVRNKWKTALVKFRLLNGMVSHIFREGNQVADTFANHACTITSPASWSQAPDFVRDSLEKNKHGIPCFRIS
jgi:ribonuclease HI